MWTFIPARRFFLCPWKWTLIISGKSRRNPHFLSISSPRNCNNFKFLFIHWRRWLPLRHRWTNAFVYHPNFLIHGVEYLHFRSRDSTGRRWYRHLRRRDLILFTCAGGGEVGACILALGGVPFLNYDVLGCHLGLGRGWLPNYGLILPFPWFKILVAEWIPRDLNRGALLQLLLHRLLHFWNW